MIDEGADIAETADGGLIAVGQTASFQGGLDVYLVRTDPAGNPKWTATMGGPQADLANAVVAAQDDSFVLVGTTYSAGPGAPKDHNVLVARVREDGAILWQHAYGGGQDDAGYDVVAIKDATGAVSSFVVAGSVESWGQGDDDIWLLKLNASGKPIWE